VRDVEVNMARLRGCQVYQVGAACSVWTDEQRREPWGTPPLGASRDNALTALTPEAGGWSLVAGGWRLGLASCRGSAVDLWR
jgi:hypothetical protein